MHVSEQSPRRNSAKYGVLHTNQCLWQLLKKKLGQEDQLHCLSQARAFRALSSWIEIFPKLQKKKN